MPDVAAVDGFATLLREMKDRSGRSYEALARRAGISSSALHRYCSGRTVPPEFEVIERLGRLCGATREEVLELHRRWAVAAAARDAAPLPGPGAPPDETGLREAEPEAGPRGAERGEAEPGRAGPREAGPRESAGPPGETGSSLPGAPPGAPRGRSGRPGRRQPAVLGAGVAMVAAALAGRRRLLLALVALAAVPALALAGWQLADRSDPGSVAAAAPAAANPYGDRLLFSAACTNSIYMGQHNDCVRELQTLLTKAGTQMAVDSDFGPETQRKVTAYQVLAGLPPNGVVDDAMKRALYAGTVRMTSWPPAQVERRIRQVFPEEPERALRIARCQSFLDPFYVLPNTNGTRNWGVFQIADVSLRRYGGTPKQAFDPEWNIQTARRLWAEDRDFSNWPHCDPLATASPSAGPVDPRPPLTR